MRNCTFSLEIARIFCKQTRSGIIPTRKANPNIFLIALKQDYTQGGYSGFQVTGMIEWSQKSRPKKVPRASSKTQKKSQKLTPKKSHADFVALKSLKEIKSSLKHLREFQ